MMRHEEIIAVAFYVFIILMLCMGVYMDFEQGKSVSVIEVTDPIEHTVDITCAMSKTYNAMIAVTAVTYSDTEVSEIVKEELTEHICRTLNDNPTRF